MKADKDWAFDIALELLKKNIETSSDWVPAENVIEFLEKTSAYLANIGNGDL